jgi:hypothetical protein
VLTFGHRTLKVATQVVHNLIFANVLNQNYKRYYSSRRRKSMEDSKVFQRGFMRVDTGAKNIRSYNRIYASFR